MILNPYDVVSITGYGSGDIEEEPLDWREEPIDPYGEYLQIDDDIVAVTDLEEYVRAHGAEDWVN